MTRCTRLVFVLAAFAGSAVAQFSCPDDSYLGGIASNVSGTTDKVLTLSITGSDKEFELKVERKVVVNGQVLWEVIETVVFTSNNHPPVTLPPGSRASIQDTDESDAETNPVIGTANLV